MSGKKAFLLVFSLVMLGLFAHFASAADDYKLSDMIEPLKAFDLAAAYEKYPLVFDLIIYFLFFISLAQVTIGSRFEGPGGRGLVIASGLALAVAMTYWAYKTGFILGRIGPLAALIFVIVLAIWIYRLLQGDQKMGATVWIAILVIYISIYTFFPEIIGALQENPWGKIGLGIFTIIFILALPMFLMNFAWGGLPEGTDEGGRGLLGGLVGEGGGRWPWPFRRKTKEEREEDELRKLTKKEKYTLDSLIHTPGWLTTEIKIKRFLEDMLRIISLHWEAVLDKFYRGEIEKRINAAIATLNKLKEQGITEIKGGLQYKKFLEKIKDKLNIIERLNFKLSKEIKKRKKEAESKLEGQLNGADVKLGKIYRKLLAVSKEDKEVELIEKLTTKLVGMKGKREEKLEGIIRELNKIKEGILKDPPDKDGIVSDIKKAIEEIDKLMAYEEEIKKELDEVFLFSERFINQVLAEEDKTKPGGDTSKLG
ncbi:hypothetical protein KY347_01700 [Candidatus Woesearchaeota archaeon]|nr:hypothetical protein [Candidatus Woesearchaeota archaeon]